MSAIDNTVTAVTEVKTIADAILAEVEQAVPGIAGQVATGQAIMDLVATMVTKALGAWSASSGTPITAESVLTLLPNATPLTPPTS